MFQIFIYLCPSSQLCARAARSRRIIAVSVATRSCGRGWCAKDATVWLQCARKPNRRRDRIKWCGCNDGETHRQLSRSWRKRQTTGNQNRSRIHRPPHAPRRSTRFVTDHWAKKMAEGSTQIQQQKKKGKDLQTLNQPPVCFIATVVALSWLQSSLRSHRIDQDRSGHGLRWKASSSNSKSIATFRHGCG